MKKSYCIAALLLFPLIWQSCAIEGESLSGNPVVEGWYADPEGVDCREYSLGHSGSERVVCSVRLMFDADGKILPVEMTFTGVKPSPLR